MNKILSDEEIQSMWMKVATYDAHLVDVLALGNAVQRAVIEKLGAGEVVPVAWIRKNGFRFNAEAEPQDDSERPLYDATALAQARQQGYEAARAEFSEYTLQMGYAADGYMDRFPLAHKLPAQFRWEEVWNVMFAARQSTKQEP